VLVPPVAERTPDLFVDEPPGPVMLGDGDVIRNATPKCRARHVTVSPRRMVPVVTPAVGRSDDSIMDAACASTDRDSSKHASGAAAMSVSILNVGTGRA
jgi:hypothetical protein